MAGTYRELDHPADLLLEVTGEGPAELAENALFALYDSVVDVDSVESRQRWSLVGRGGDTAQALRSLLAEALFLIDTEGLLGAAARVSLGTEGGARGGPEGGGPEGGPEGGGPDDDPENGEARRDADGRAEPGSVTLLATVWGEPLDRDRHDLKAEVKAVTYHRLAADELAPGVWRATILLDV